ncbi:MAG TPA: 1-acyl-sn-glycerol-3-phosphate acyltransferase [Candidatus Angelobacter sp.]|nr:1-acyl-sn-glycerol-3-phosphate acyltransferase [Candidatus Angelobacter sp.]
MILIADVRQSLPLQLQRALGSARLISAENFCASACNANETCIYLPAADRMLPDQAEARQVIEHASQTKSGHFILLSSAAVYGIGENRQALAVEDYSLAGCESQKICAQWKALEQLATTTLKDKSTLTILRPCPIAERSTFPASLLSHRMVTTLPGHDPVFQFLSVADLARAILCIMERKMCGIFNVAPENVAPLHQAIRILGSTRLPFPRMLQRIARGTEFLEYLRYSWTISGRKMERELGFRPQHSSMEALLQLHGNETEERALAEFDLFGMDKDYIRFYGKTLFKFLSDFYWRIEDRGMEHIPAQGRALLVGMHRGFMPFDGVMALHTIAKKTGRYPRFLTHPGLLKFPFLANFMTKLGGVVACQESADRVLEGDDLLGIFPEGIHGAFTLYRDAYKLQGFARDAFVKLALRHRAPIVPFVTVGSAEIFPIFGKIKSRRWTRYAGWPFIPITPTFPLAPVPLPSKWHTQFLPAISTAHYGPEAAEDRAVVRAISREVRMRMQQAVDEMLARRKSIFFGSIFKRSQDEGQSKPLPV